MWSFDSRTPEELDARRQEWATHHGQKTNDICGVLPLVMDMPIRITQTDPNHKQILFKNRRCRLHGWKLHDVDLARLQGCSTQEMILEYLLLEIFLKIQRVTWVWSPDLGPEVIAPETVVSVWHLERQCQLAIRRHGFTVVSDFSGTAHSFAGYTLPAAFTDCLPWHWRPDKAGQIGTYMSISRVRKLEDIYITQPFAPTLLSQGDLPGPELLLKF